MGRKLVEDEDLRDGDRELGLNTDMDIEELDLDTLRGGTDRFFLDEEDLGAESGSDGSWSGTARRRRENSRDSRNRR